MFAGFANELCVSGRGETSLCTLFEEWSFGVVVREMLMAVNCIFLKTLPLYNLKVLCPICCVTFTVLALGLY